jgi:hypothetical protein
MLAIATGFAWASYRPIVEHADARRGARARTLTTLIAANLGQAVVPDSAKFDRSVGNLTADEYRRATHFYGIPTGTRRAPPDRAIVRIAGIRPRPRGQGACEFPSPVLEAPPASNVVIETGTVPTDVTVRRFGSEPILTGHVRPRAAAVVVLPSLSSPRPWIVTADAACVKLD